MVFDSFLSVGSVNVLVGEVGLVFGLLLVGFEFWFGFSVLISVWSLIC